MKVLAYLNAKVGKQLHINIQWQQTFIHYCIQYWKVTSGYGTVFYVC